MPQRALLSRMQEALRVRATSRPRSGHTACAREKTPATRPPHMGGVSIAALLLARAAQGLKPIPALLGRSRPPSRSAPSVRY